MRHSDSVFLDIRGLRYHVRHWKGQGEKLFLLHGWMDVSASFQFLVDAFTKDWDVYAPDWRGYGHTSWSGSDNYWFPDYMGDLDVLLERLQPEAPVNLVGHSLGGNVGGLYAGVRPERIARFVNLEGFGMPITRAEQAPKRYARWMDELKEAPAGSLTRATPSLPTACRRTTRACRASAPSSSRVTGARTRSRAASCCAATRHTSSSMQRSTAWTRRAPAGSASPRRCCGWTPRNPKPCGA
jgi:pimeloyl-ACP methyl ester carboxylesterase